MANKEIKTEQAPAAWWSIFTGGFGLKTSHWYQDGLPIDPATGGLQSNI